MHPATLAKFAKDKQQPVKRKGDELSGSLKKKVCMDENLTIGVGASSVLSLTQGRIDALVTNFVIEDMQSLSVVEQPAFVRLIHGLQPSKKVITRNCLLYTSPSPRDGLLSRMPSSA